jgi:hypothetical protein
MKTLSEFESLFLSLLELYRIGACIPRRKYGRMVKPLMPVEPKKCRFCRLGRNCPIHGEPKGSEE